MNPSTRPLTRAIRAKMTPSPGLSRNRAAAWLLSAAAGTLVPLASIPAGCGHGDGMGGTCHEQSSAATSAVAPNEAASALAEPTCSCACETATAALSAAPSGSAEPPAEKALGCPEDMALVEGQYCPNVEQRCLEHGLNSAKEEIDAICLKFEKPSVCLSPSRAHMRYCMDRYEYPNKPGELPQVLTTWEEAAHLCHVQGKRMCSESEFSFACEGEEMLPYSYGFERDPAKCNQDKPYRDPPDNPFRKWNECMRDRVCSAAFAKLDQREPIGSRPECVSPFGIHDLNGNANEFVILRYQQPPHRAALKGGWWGPVRSRCRPIVMHHDEKYLGYETGFRCCRSPVQEARKSKRHRGPRR